MNKLIERWREYGARPPRERWTSRVSYLLGLLIGCALVALMTLVVMWLIRLGALWLWHNVAVVPVSWWRRW